MFVCICSLLIQISEVTLTISQNKAKRLMALNGCFCVCLSFLLRLPQGRRMNNVTTMSLFKSSEFLSSGKVTGGRGGRFQKVFLSTLCASEPSAVNAVFRIQWKMDIWCSSIWIYSGWPLETQHLVFKEVTLQRHTKRTNLYNPVWSKSLPSPGLEWSHSWRFHTWDSGEFWMETLRQTCTVSYWEYWGDWGWNQQCFGRQCQHNRLNSTQLTWHEKHLTDR